MTEGQKQALIEWCNWRIGKGRNTLLADASYDAAVVALAALTAQPVKVDDSMALAFHKALNDGGVGHDDLEEIKVGLEAALCNIPRPAPATDLAELVPPKASMADYYENVENPNLVEPDEAGITMWDACRAEMLRKIEERS